MLVFITRLCYPRVVRVADTSLKVFRVYVPEGDSENSVHVPARAILSRSSTDVGNKSCGRYL